MSLEVAAAAAANFADGAVLVRLDTLRDEALLPHSILAVPPASRPVHQEAA